MRQPRVIVLLVALALAGCATAKPKPVPPAPAETSVPAPPPPMNNPPEPPIAKERPQPIDPKKLVGLTRDEIKEMIGTPSTVHDEPPAVIWSYGSDGCRLEVFFYPDVADQTLKSLTYDVKPKGAHGLSGGACLASLRTTAK